MTVMDLPPPQMLRGESSLDVTIGAGNRTIQSEAEELRQALASLRMHADALTENLYAPTSPNTLDDCPGTTSFRALDQRRAPPISAASRQEQHASTLPAWPPPRSVSAAAVLWPPDSSFQRSPDAKPNHLQVANAYHWRVDGVQSSLGHYASAVEVPCTAAVPISSSLQPYLRSGTAPAHTPVRSHVRVPIPSTVKLGAQPSVPQLNTAIASLPKAESDREIDRYLELYKNQVARAPAVSLLVRSWRTYKQRKFFVKYSAVRIKNRCKIVRPLYDIWKGRILAKRTSDIENTARSVLCAWLEYSQELTKFSRQVALCLQRSAKRVQIPAIQLWRVCSVVDGITNPSISAFLAAVAVSTVPQRRQRAILLLWRRGVQVIAKRRAAATRRLHDVSLYSLNDCAEIFFRFWFRYSLVKRARRLQIEPPEFLPGMPVWDEWVWRHPHKETQVAAVKQRALYFTMRIAFAFLRKFTLAVTTMRRAWSGVMNSLDQLLKKRNFQRWRTLNLVARYNKRLLFRCLMSMHSIMRYNTQMRTIKFNLAHVVDRSRKRHVLTKFRQNVKYRRILNTAASMRMLSKPALLQLAAFAWRGELDRAWFAQCFLRWSAHSRRRMRMKCFMAVHVAEHATKLLQWGFRCFCSRRHEARQHTASAAMDMDSDDEHQGIDFFGAMAGDPDIGLWRPEMPLHEDRQPKMLVERSQMQMRKHIQLVKKAALIDSSHLSERPAAIPQLLPPARAPYPIKRCLDAWDNRDELMLTWSQSDDVSGYHGSGIVFWRKLVAVTEMMRKDGIQMPAEQLYVPPRESEEAVHDALDDHLVLGERLLHARANQLLGSDYRSESQLVKLLASKGDLLGDALSRFFAVVVRHDAARMHKMLQFRSVRDHKLKVTMRLHLLAKELGRSNSGFSTEAIRFGATSDLPTDFAISSGDESDKEDQVPTRSLFSRKWVNAEMYQQFSGDAHDVATFEDLSDLQATHSAVKGVRPRLTDEDGGTRPIASSVVADKNEENDAKSETASVRQNTGPRAASPYQAAKQEGEVAFKESAGAGSILDELSRLEQEILAGYEGGPTRAMYSPLMARRMREEMPLQTPLARQSLFPKPRAGKSKGRASRTQIAATQGTQSSPPQSVEPAVAPPQMSQTKEYFMREHAHSRPLLDTTLVSSADDTMHEAHDPPSAEGKAVRFVPEQPSSTSSVKDAPTHASVASESGIARPQQKAEDPAHHTEIPAHLENPMAAGIDFLLQDSSSQKAKLPMQDIWSPARVPSGHAASASPSFRFTPQEQMKLTALKHRVAGMRASDRHRKKGDHRSFVRASSPVRSSPSRPRRFDAAERAGGALSIPEFTAHQMPRLGSMSLHGVDDDNWEDADTQILRRSRLLHSGEEKSASSAKHSHGKAGDDREPFAHDNRSSTGVDVENEPQSKPPVPRPHAGSPGLADGQEVLSTSEGPWSTVAVGSADLSLLNGGVAPPKGGIPSGNSKRDGLLEPSVSTVSNDGQKEEHFFDQFLYGPLEAKNAFYDSQAELRQSTFKAHARRELQRQVQLLTWLSTPQHEFAPEERLDSQRRINHPHNELGSPWKPFSDAPHPHILPTLPPPSNGRPAREHQPLYMVSSLKTLNTSRPSSGGPPQMQVVTGGIGLPGRPRTEGGARRGPVALVGHSSARVERPNKLSASPNPYALRHGQHPSWHNASVIIPSEGPWRMYAPAEASPQKLAGLQGKQFESRRRTLSSPASDPLFGGLSAARETSAQPMRTRVEEK